MLFCVTSKGNVVALKESDPSPPDAVAFCRDGFPYWITGREQSCDDPNAKPYRPNVLRKPQDIADLMSTKPKKAAVEIVSLFDDEEETSGPYGHEESE